MNFSNSSNENNMDIMKIMQTIPHRYPFLLIDRVLEFEVGKKIIALKNVSVNEYFFQGHFPQEPVMPGVLIVEAMAQAGACAVMSMDAYKGKIAYLAALDKVKIRGKVVPGDTLRLEVEIIKLKSSAGIGKGTAFVGEKKVCEAELTFMFG